MTYEEGEDPDEYIFDIFNSEGVFIGRISLGVYLSDYFLATGGQFDSWASMKKNRFYCIREKESGYKELVVYEVIWE
jgi:hypothetical protein